MTSSRRERPGSCGSQRLMTATDTGAYRAIIRDSSRPHPARPRQLPPGDRSAAPAGLPGHDQRPARSPWPPPPAGRDPGHGRRGGAGRRTIDGRDRRVGCGCPQLVRVALGARRDGPAHWVVPSEATIRRTLARLEAEALAEVIGAWLADRDRPDQRRRRRAVAVDGKTLRGARRDGRAVHLLAAMEYATRRVLAQRAVNGAPGEAPGFQPLLADLDLAGAVVTADALHAYAEAAQFLVTTKR